MSLVRAFLGFALASVLGAVSTYVLFLVFAHSARLEDLGRYGIWMAVVSTVVNVVVAVTEQRVAQLYSERGRAGGSPEDLLRHYAGARMAYVAVASTLLSLVVAGLSGDVRLAGAVLAASVGQGMYGVAMGPRVFGASRAGVLALQAANALLVGIVSATLVLEHEEAMSVHLMLLLTGVVRVVGTLPFAAGDVIRTRSRGPANPSLGSALIGRTTWSMTAKLVALQGLNAVTASADSLVLGIAGPRAVGSYQLVQRPMLGLGVLNSALGQLAYNRALRAGGTRLSRAQIMTVGLGIVSAWTASGFAVYLFVLAVSPADANVSLPTCLALGLAYGLGAIAAVTGPRLLVARASGALLVAGAAQAIVLVSTGLVLVSAWGAMGIVAALVLSRSVVVVVQLRAAQSLDHHVVVSTAMEVDSAG